MIFAHTQVIEMSTVLEIERAIEQLPPDELASFRKWYLEFDADLWDRQIEEDIDAGRLDELAAEALAEVRAGRSTVL